MISQSNTIFPDRRPDLVLADLAQGELTVESPVSWLQACVPVIVRADEADAPMRADEDCINPIMLEAADYARMHLSLRPFQLFSFILLFHGNTFTITYWDRVGAVVSREYSLNTDRLLFVILVRRLSRELSLYDLGFDRSVRFSPASSLFATPYPSYEVWVGGQAKRYGPPPYDVSEGYWTTVGPPIWQSLAFIGRGTSAWHAISPAGQKQVLKNSWRDENRDPETLLYRRLLSLECKGVARFAIGGGVIVNVANKTQPDFQITTNIQRNRFGFPQDLVHPILNLHRLVLHSVGRPIWAYTSPREFVRAMRDCIDGNRKVYASLCRLLTQDSRP